MKTVTNDLEDTNITKSVGFSSEPESSFDWNSSVHESCFE